MSRLESLVIPARGEHRATVIWLHGLGADGHDFEPLIPQLGLSERGVRVLLPHAPLRPVTVNAGLRMRAWYDIAGPTLDQAVDRAGILASAGQVEALIAAEQAAGLDASRMVLAGFSQGGVVALQTGLTRAEPLAGVLGLSCYLALPEAAGVSRERRILLMHGRQDAVVPLPLAELACRQLQQGGHQVELRRYAMEHALCAEQVAELRDWFAAVLP